MALGSGLSVYYRVFSIMLFMLAGGFVWAFLNSMATRVTAERTYSKLHVGEYIDSLISVRNFSPLPKFNLEINDLSEMPGHNTGEVIDLPPMGERSLMLKIPLMKRGVYSVGTPTVSSRDPFGIFRLRKQASGTERLAVLPYMVDVSPFSLDRGNVTGEGALQKSTPESSSSVSTIREYRPGESARYIHWPATARKNSLMLKEFDSGTEDVTWILLDLQGEVKEGDEIENTEEYAITAAASIARAYAQMGWAVGLMAHGDRQHFIVPHEGGTSLDRILVALTEARAEGSVPLVDLIAYWQSEIPSPNISLVVITSSLETTWNLALESCMRQGVSATVVLVDPTSFGGLGNPQILLSQLNGRGTQTYLLRKGDDLSRALNHPWRLSDRQQHQERVEALP